MKKKMLVRVTRATRVTRTRLTGLGALASLAVTLAATMAAPLALAAPPAPTDPKLVQRVAENETYGSGKVVLNRGHVDLGPRLTDGNWQLVARDDTGKSPVWRQVGDIVFQLGDQAKQTVPDNEQFGFLPRGQAVYAIGQTEIPGVVWLGWNTQSPEVVKALSVGAKLTFLGHSGPGDFALFIQAGNFGKAQPLWLSTKSGSQDIFVEPNTHTHANWVFTKPGIHLVKVAMSAQLSTGKTVSATQTLRFAVGAETDVKAAQTAVWVDKVTQSPNGASGLIIAGALAALVTISSLVWLWRRKSKCGAGENHVEN